MDSSTLNVRRKWYHQERICERSNHKLALEGEEVFSIQVDREGMVASGMTRLTEKKAKVKSEGYKKSKI